MDFKKEAELLFHKLMNEIGDEELYYELQTLELGVEDGSWHDLKGLDKTNSGTAISRRPEIRPDDFKPLTHLESDSEGFKQTPYDNDHGEPFETVDEVVANNEEGFYYVVKVNPINESINYDLLERALKPIFSKHGLEIIATDIRELEDIDVAVGSGKMCGHCFENVKKEIEENEIIELNDILEDGNPEELIKKNIEYILEERGVYERAKEKGEDVQVKVEVTETSNDEQGTDTLMGYYNASNSYEGIDGVFIADGYMEDGKLHLISLTIGDSDLKYFGN